MTPSEQFPKLADLIEYLDGLEDRADLEILASHLKALDLTRADVADAVRFNPGGYRRNRISGSAHYELLVLCWRSGQASPIHDHQGSSCAFCVIEGSGTEIRFARTPSGLICPTEARPMNHGFVCASDEADIHQVANMQAPGEDLLTLHIYSPPLKRMNAYQMGSVKVESREEPAEPLEVVTAARERFVAP